MRTWRASTRRGVAFLDRVEWQHDLSLIIHTLYDLVSNPGYNHRRRHHHYGQHQHMHTDDVDGELDRPTPLVKVMFTTTMRCSGQLLDLVSPQHYLELCEDRNLFGP